MNPLPPEFLFLLKPPVESLYQEGRVGYELLCPCGEVVSRWKREQHFNAHVRQQKAVEAARQRKLAQERERLLARARAAQRSDRQRTTTEEE